MNRETLQAELEARLCGDYARAFSERDVAALASIYRPNSVVIFHQLGEDKSGRGGKGKDVALYNGSMLAALLRLTIPASLGARTLFKRLRKRDYGHSTIQLLAFEDLSTAGQHRARVNCSFERFRRNGDSLETGYGLYLMEKIDGLWRISEIWIYDDINAPPAELQLDRLTAV
ncbi:MAG: hypothetical protein AAGJ52_03465 [Pseudomonadota bacterium]